MELIKYLFIDNHEVKGLIMGLEEFSTIPLEITWIQSHSIDDVMNEIENSEFSGIIFDFYLQNVDNLKEYKSNPLAQWVRDNSIEDKYREKFSIPIVLFSSLKKLDHGYFIEPTAKDLHDKVYVKDDVGLNPAKTANELVALVHGYQKTNLLKKESFVNNEVFFGKLLDIDDGSLILLDARIFSKENSSSAPTHQLVRYVLHEMILKPSFLIDEDLLSARLGVRKNSEGWQVLKDVLTASAGYTGILSDGWQRWNMMKILSWWNEEENGKLQNLSARERVKILTEKFGFDNLDAHVITLVNKWQQKKENFWHVCQKLNIPLHSSEGVLVYESKNYPWQENQYYSFGAFTEDEELINKIPFVEVARVERELNKLYGK